jgi:hypothetical protein
MHEGQFNWYVTPIIKCYLRLHQKSLSHSWQQVINFNGWDNAFILRANVIDMYVYY